MNDCPSMTVKDGLVHYSDPADHVDICFPVSEFAGFPQICEMPVISDPSSIMRELVSPSCGQSIRELVLQSGARSASIIISDATRGVPTHLAAPHIIRELLSSGIPMDNILFVVALGVHREATNDEIRSFLGEEFYEKVRVENNRPDDADSYINLGVTSHGTPIEVYRNAYLCDLHLSVGKVEPHGFAGFSGGRKSVLPGISSRKTIAANHSPDKMVDPNCASGILAGNIIHEDMQEAAKAYRLDYTVNFVLNDALEPSAVFAGEPERCHHAAVEYIKRYCGIKLKNKPDIFFLNTGKPKNIDFYQAINSLAAVEPVLRPGSIVVLCAECPEGMNSADMIKPFNAVSTLDDVGDYMLANWEIQMDSSLLIYKLLRYGIQILTFSPHIQDKEFTSLYFKPFHSAQEALNGARALSGKEHPSIFIFPHPQKYLPIADYV